MAHKRHINPPLNIYRKIALSFIILTIILIGVIFYFTLSYSYISITPKEEAVNSDFNFIIVEDDKAVNSEEGIFIGKIINETFEGEKEFAATGAKQLVGEMAGTVEIFNKLSVNQSLIINTRLLSPEGILFRLKNRVDVPAGKSIKTDVYPDDLSKTVATAGTKFTLPGLSPNLQQLIYAAAVNDFKVAGQEVKVISAEDLDNSVNSLGDELAQQLIKDEDVNKAKILNKEILSKEFSNKVDDQTDKFTTKISIKVIGVIFDEQPAKDYAKKILGASIPADKQLMANNSDKMVYQLDNTDLVNKIAQIKGNIKGIMIISENSQILDKDKLSRLSSDELKAYLENFNEIEKVEIKYFPSWMKKMPFFKDHIIIQLIK
ncbi:MAG: hypothetical protein A2Y67_03250 [Candidatus Buchananbacteria bacterium RBG_13_39_9]|uniref:Baseplate protein J-like domain-containing protein n=1 Tax=Candidatus Buchananbacteria bacterium RBG_13_39_9 TaxID=1797531 RepID=A0A1G1XPW8_9BACT|nr:MAG: hypothetical protein A2Y67_03250 [Candidatus Buchananbacteria bacterium RBG_13_39_9]